VEVSVRVVLGCVGAKLLPLVRAGVRFVDGVRQEREKKGTERKGKAA